MLNVQTIHLQMLEHMLNVDPAGPLPNVDNIHIMLNVDLAHSPANVGNVAARLSGGGVVVVAHQLDGCMDWRCFDMVGEL